MSEPLVKDMQLTAEDFRRWLPGAVAPSQVRGAGDRLVVDDGDARTIDIELTDLPPRRIALLCLPVTRVTMTFSANWEVQRRAALLKRFDDRFRRGGG